jgi:hypothetical protein
VRDDTALAAASNLMAPEQQMLPTAQHGASIVTGEGTELQEMQGMQPGVLATDDGPAGLESQDQPSTDQQQEPQQRQQGRQQQQQQKPRPTHFVSLRVSQYPQVRFMLPVLSHTGVKQ